jgi:hypothetical protein
MMKKYLLMFALLFSFVKADIVQDGIDLVKKESLTQDSLAGAIELYVEVFGVNPTSLTQLKTAGYIDNAFSFGGSFSVGATSFLITSTIVNPQQYQIDFFLNDYNRGRSITPTNSGTSFTTTFYFGRKAIYSKNLKTSGIDYVQSSAPTSTTVNNTWWDTSKQQMYIYIGGWQSLNAKKLWIFRNTTELNATAVTPNENDGAVVIDATGTSLVKYLYVGGAWRVIPQTIPFAYNGAF